MSNIVLNSLTYVGNGIINGIASFIERSAGIVTAFKTLTSRVSYADRINVHWKLVLPSVVAADSECGCAGELQYTNYVDITYRADRRTTAAERTATLAAIRDLVATTNFGDSITSLVVTP